MILVILKVTLVLSLAMIAMPLLGRATSALRHLLLTAALAGTLLLPLGSAIPPEVVPMHIPIVFAVDVLSGTTARNALSLWVIAQWIWAAGTLIFLSRIAFGYWRVSNLIDGAARSEGYLLADVSVPMVTGLFRAVILLPRDAERWARERRDAALRHERAHVDRKDLWTDPVAHIACAIYWFHPLAWAVARRMRDEREAACDDAVLRSGFEPVGYAEALIATARCLNSELPMGRHMTTRQSLKSRIARLLDTNVPRVSSPSTLRGTTVLLAGALACIALLNGPLPAGAQTTSTNMVLKGDDPGVTPPALIYRTDPEYSEAARRARIEGPVNLRVTVGVDGRAHDVKVIQGIDPDLDANAVKTIEKWHFRPATREGVAVPVSANIQVNFRLI